MDIIRSEANPIDDDLTLMELKLEEESRPIREEEGFVEQALELEHDKNTEGLAKQKQIAALASQMPKKHHSCCVRSMYPPFRISHSLTGILGIHLTERAFWTAYTFIPPISGLISIGSLYP